MNFGDAVLFTLPTRVFFGYNSVGMTGSQAKKLGAKKVLLVTDRGVRQAGVIDPAVNSLETAQVPYEIFDEVPEDPKTGVVDKGIQILKDSGCNAVVVVGGGSPLCAGKGIALLATNGGDLRDYEGVDKYKERPLPLIAIPTTAGSGSEVSASFIISDERRNNYKMTVNGFHCHPDVAILDPMLLRLLPARQFIISGVDALSHAIEALWTTLATPLTDSIAYQAIYLIMKNLAAAAYSNSLEAKKNQLFGSTIANIACGNAKLGLVHAMSNPIGSYHVSHGLANGILLPYVMEYNMSVCENKLARMAQVIGAAKPHMSTAEKALCALASLRELLVALDFADRIPENIVPRTDIPQMVSLAMGRSQVKVNLRKPNAADVAQIFARAYEGWKK